MTIDVVCCLSEFVGEAYVVFAGVSKTWKAAWGDQRVKVTRAITPYTSISQLPCAFECGLHPGFRLCGYAAATGRLEVLRCARQNGCPRSDTVLSQTALEEHLDIVRWGWANGCPMSWSTCNRYS